MAKTTEKASPSKWQEPPRAVERYDPTGLIGADDLPTWIRGFVAPVDLDTDAQDAEKRVQPVIETPSDQLPSTDDTAAAEPSDDGVTAPAQMRTPDAVAEDSSVTTAEVESAAVGDAAPAETTSDLTETRFVLLAGAALIIILAVLARFYL